MKYLRRELNQVEKEYFKTIWTRLLGLVSFFTIQIQRIKQEVQDTIDILKEAMAKINL